MAQYEVMITKHKSLMHFFWVLFLSAICFALHSSTTLAASCCSSSSAVPSLITGDNLAQVSANLSYGTVIGDADTDGLPRFRSALDSENTRTLKLDGALLLSDRSQIGAGIPIVSKSVARGSNQSRRDSLGDIEFSLGYETLPEWSYSEWKPRGHSFLSFTAPTGKSIYEATEAGMVDASGKGFYRIGLGMIFTKRWNTWDAQSSFEVHRSIPRTFNPTLNNPDPLRVDAGWGTSFGIGAGYSPHSGNLRFGFRINPSFSQAKKIQTTSGEENGSSIQTIDTGLEASYLLSERAGGSWTASTTYTDQTLLGPAKNSTLSRVFAIALQHRWDR